MNKSLVRASAVMLAISARLYGEEKATGQLAGDYGAKPMPARSAGLLNDWLRSQSDGFDPWDLGGQSRVRYEHREYFSANIKAGEVDFRRVGGDPDNSFLLYRQFLHLGYAPVSWLNFYVEGRESSSTGDDRDPNPDSDFIDLYQAYARIGDPKAFPISVQVGRQELLYGDERLVGSSDWTNVKRSFDAVKLRYERPEVWVDAFVSRVVMPYDNHFNVSNDYDWFSGIYASTTALAPKQETQLYLLSRNVGLKSPAAIGPPPAPQGASPRDIYTVGLRIKSLPGAFGGWDYGAELMGQFGHFKETATGAPAVLGKNLSQEAYAAYLGGGHTWTNTWATPRLGVEYNFSSGDDDPTDGRHGTFDNLFPTNHKSYGYMDFFSLQNIHNVRFMSSLKPLKKLTVTADYHLFWLADTHDSFYTINGARRGGLGTTPGPGYGINPGYSSFVGSEVDLVGTYAIKKYALLQAGYGHFFVGGYVKSSLAAIGGAVDADWVYGQLTFNF